jgi:electron transport complex protein RnfG
MERLKSNLQNMVGVLVGVAFACALLLSVFNKITAGPVAEQAAKALQDGIKHVMKSDSVVVESDTVVEKEFNGKMLSFVVHNTNKGVAIESTDPNAFGGNLKVLVGFNEEGKILGYTILESAETPGLGAKASEWFVEGAPGSIVGLSAWKNNLTVKQDGGEVNAITASTITSRSFLRAVTQAWSAYRGDKDDAKTGATQQVEKGGKNE